MKKQGTVKVYKHFPINSLSYKLSELRSTRNTIYSTITRLVFTTPVMTFNYVAIGLNLGSGWVIFGVAFQALELAYDIPKVIKSSKQLKQIKQDIAKHLSKVESDVITNEEDQKELVKRI